jgi:hypothetical protein
VLFHCRLVGIFGLSFCGGHHRAGAGTLQGEAATGFFILAAGLLHWVLPRLRLPLAVAGAFDGFYGAYFLFKSSNLLYNWNILNRTRASAPGARRIPLV